MANSPSSLEKDLHRYIDGEDAVADAICAHLQPTMRVAAQRVLGMGDVDCDDIVQESLLAVLRYLRRSRVVPDNIEAFASKIARNRSLNLTVWRRKRTAADVDDFSERIKDVGASPLEMIDAKERSEMAEDVLSQLDAPCRELLLAIYRAEASMEKLREKLELGSVQAVYYRRDACIRKAQKILNRLLFIGREFAKDGDRSAPDQRELENENG